MSRYHLKQYEKEHMKMAMLKQEETFKQQVRTKRAAWSSKLFKNRTHICHSILNCFHVTFSKLTSYICCVH